MAYEGFKKLAAETSPAIAASIGRKKYGKKKFQNAAAKGKKLEGAKPMKGGEYDKKLKDLKKKNSKKNGPGFSGAYGGK